MLGRHCFPRNNPVVSTCQHGSGRMRQGAMTGTGTDSLVLRQCLGGRDLGGLRLLDAVCWQGGDGLHEVRAFFATGTKVAAFDPAPRAGCR